VTSHRRLRTFSGHHVHLRLQKMAGTSQLRSLHRRCPADHGLLGGHVNAIFAIPTPGETADSIRVLAVADDSRFFVIPGTPRSRNRASIWSNPSTAASSAAENPDTIVKKLEAALPADRKDLIQEREKRGFVAPGAGPSGEQGPHREDDGDLQGHRSRHQEIMRGPRSA